MPTIVIGLLVHQMRELGQVGIGAPKGKRMFLLPAQTHAEDKPGDNRALDAFIQ